MALFSLKKGELSLDMDVGEYTIKVTPFTLIESVRTLAKDLILELKLHKENSIQEKNGHKSIRAVFRDGSVLAVRLFDVFSNLEITIAVESIGRRVILEGLKQFIFNYYEKAFLDLEDEESNCWVSRHKTLKLL